MDFAHAFMKFTLIIAARIAVCLVAIGVLLIFFPKIFLTVVLYTGGAAFILMGMFILISFIFAALRTKIGEVAR